MGSRGPAKTPAAFKIVQGTYREDRDGINPQAVAGVPDKPDWLSRMAIASEVWDERIETLSRTPDLLSPNDGPALAAYCVAWQRFHEAQEEINRDGITCYSEKGAQYQHPAVGIQNKALETIARIGAKFGMTPSDRSSLKMQPAKQEGVRRRQHG